MENNPFFDIYIDEGAAFDLAVSIVDVQYDDLTGEEIETVVSLVDIASVQAVVKKDYQDSSPVIVAFNAGILGDPASGEIFLGLSGNQTTGLHSGPNPVYQLGYYDIMLTKTSGSKVKLVGGKVFINQTVTL